jgi:secreted PhoX family phosphatase
MKFRSKVIAASVSLAFAALGASALAETIKGPTSSATPYMVNVPASVDVISLITVGDSVNEKPGATVPYRMVGIPDGMGAFDNGDGTFTVLMNHELGATSGVARRHGFAGAFVSQWIVRKSDLAVLHGGDLMKQVLEWNAATGAYQPATRALGRLCSADLPATTAFYNRRTGKGYTGRIFMDGEEVGSEGRAFAHIVTGPNAGVSYELPSLGKFSWENSVASPYEQDKTVVIGQDDSTPGQLYVYIGEKQATGDEIKKAGLVGGWLYGVKVQGYTVEDNAAAAVRGPGIPSGTAFTLHPFNDVRAVTGAQLQAASVAAGVTEFLRPEDGAWDTKNPNRYYFVTTDRFDGTKDGSGTTIARSRLYRLSFHDIRSPELGGVIDQLIDGTGPSQMFDNITVDGDGNLILMEDPGNQAHLARIWKFYPSNRRLVEVAKHDPERFGTPTPPFNRDEESSGVIEVTDLLRRAQEHERDDDDDEVDEHLPWAKRGYRYYLGVTQAHYNAGDAELVEGGQLYLFAVPRNLR